MEPVYLPEIFRAAFDADAMGRHHAMPATVVAYSPGTATEMPTIIARPCVKRIVPSDPPSYEDLPDLLDVPVAYPRGGGFVVSWPLAVGDSVMLVFSDTSTAEWRDAGQVSDHVDTQRHTLSYPVAYPGVWPDGQALSATDAAARVAGIVIGKDGDPAFQIRVTDTDVQIGTAPTTVTVAPTGITLATGATDTVALATPTVAFLTAVRTMAGALSAGLLTVAGGFTAPQAAAVQAAAIAVLALGSTVAAVPATLVKAK